jgi:ubiquinone/menaquinone biosynthesis C-methylase UbiE
MKATHPAKIPVLLLALFLAGLPAVLAGYPSHGQEHGSQATEKNTEESHAGPQHDHGKHEGGEHKGHTVLDHSFADVDRWLKVFESPERDQWQQPAEVVKAMGVGPGSVVADIGAGTGYFAVHLARAVWPDGKVLAIDTEPNMVAFMEKRAADAGLDVLETVLADADDPHIPPGSTHRILLVDTYHHIHDRPGYFRRLKAALAPGGQVVVVDFLKKSLPVGPPPEHKMSRDEVVAEFEEAGYRLASEETFLPYQYFLFFEPVP